MIKLGNTIISHGLFLAPMAGCSDRAMREIASEHGAEFTTTEMVSAKAVCHGDVNSIGLGMVSTLPSSVQLFGHEPLTMAKAAYRLIEENSANGFEINAIDVNMGCPVRKIVSNGDGSALLENPSLAWNIVREIKKNIDIPVTVKIRIGISGNRIIAADFAKKMEDAGADMITVHGRTRADMYSPPVNYEAIADVCRSVSVPVVGNGGIFTLSDAQKMLETGVNGLMIGRGALGNPWIFEKIASFIDSRQFTAPSKQKIIEAALRQLKLTCLYKGERTAVLEGRRQVAYYIKGFSGAAGIRGEINKCDSIDGIERILLRICDE